MRIHKTALKKSLRLKSHYQSFIFDCIEYILGRNFNPFFMHHPFIWLRQVSKIKQEYSLKEKLLEARIDELEEYSRSSNDDLTRLLTAQQKCIQRLKEESKNAVQCFETNVTKLE